jgi:RND family efflux transporter MFP subunit
MQWRSGMRRLAVATILGIALLAVACSDTNPAASANPTPVTTPSTRPVAAVESADAGLTVSGPLIVEHQLDITAQRDGILDKIFFDAPAHVKAGTLLGQLDARQIQANLDAAKAKSRSIEADLKNWESEAEVLKADYVRQQRLFSLGLTSEEQLQHAQYKAESDIYDIQRVKETLITSHEEEHSLQLELEKTKIVAPFDGVVARRYAREGQSVAKGDRLFWVTAEGPILMRFTMPEKFFGRIHPGQPMEIMSPDVAGEKHAARVKQISPVIDPSSGTFEVLVELVGDRGSLRPGMTASARIDTPR